MKNLTPHPTFPGKFAGASLKQDGGHDTFPVHCNIPRQICRGLIEAIGGSVRRRTRPRAFPGKFAGASLKRPPVMSRNTNRNMIPRQICRGLIEAATADLRLSGQSETFPGKFAGASLKHGARHRRVPDPAQHSPANLPGPH